MNIPVVIHKDRHSDYGVTVPDLPGCFSAGKTLDVALAMAKEAIELHLEGLIAEGQAVPVPQTIERHQANAEYRNGTWAVVGVDDSKLRLNAVRINISVPERVLDAVDRYAAKVGETRSGLLVRAVTEYMSESTSGRETTTASRRKRTKRTKRPAASRKS